MRITRVDTAKCNGGENPLWDTAEQALYFVDNMGQKLHRYDYATGKTRSWDTPSVITAMALRKGGGAVVTLWTGIHTMDLDTGKFEVVSPLTKESGHVFNDAKVDRRGRFLIGGTTANFENPTPDGGVYSLDANQKLSVLDTGIYFSNGPCFSPDDKTFYFADSYHATTYAYDYDIATGKIANRRPFVNTKDLGGAPDGTTVDRDGLVWTAIYQGGKIAAFRPDGKLERVVEMPVKLTSSVMFGGPDLDKLYVTTIEKNHIGPACEVEEGAGDVFVIEGLGARGVPETRYAG
jgi:sugar lactone lactonase YvrE